MERLFKGNIIKQIIDSNKLDINTTIRTVTIGDLHGYTNNSTRSNRLALAIKRLEPDIIFIAGDLFNGGNPWNGGDKLNEFKKFIQDISEGAIVCITWGNHDLRFMNKCNREIRFSNFYNLENERPGKIYPLYNDVVTINNMEILGYVPRNELVELSGIKIQAHGIAHDMFIKEYHNEGVKFSDDNSLYKVYLGHDPHLIATSENGIGLEDLKVCDFFVEAHMHDGYKNFYKLINYVKKQLTGEELKMFELDKGVTEKPFGDVNRKGYIIPGTKKLLGPINLCRGIIYINDEAQQKFLQLNNDFYYNNSLELNTHEWKEVVEERARDNILENNLHPMLVSNGISPSFIYSEKDATINYVEIKGKKLIKK